LLQITLLVATNSDLNHPECSDFKLNSLVRAENPQHADQCSAEPLEPVCLTCVHHFCFL